MVERKRVPTAARRAARSRTLRPLRRGLAAFATAAALFIGCSGSTVHPLAGWSEGPVRWLLLPAEYDALDRVRTEAQARVFIASFWGRRDPAIVAPFSSRVAAADELYGDEEERGSLTDRGRALLLLGPPPLLRTDELAVPSWSPATAAGAPPPRATVRVETWSYPLEELPAALREALAEEVAAGADRVDVSFVVENDRVRLRDGEDILEIIQRAVVKELP